MPIVSAQRLRLFMRRSLARPDAPPREPAAPWTGASFSDVHNELPLVERRSDVEELMQALGALAPRERG